MDKKFALLTSWEGTIRPVVEAKPLVSQSIGVLAHAAARSSIA
ncbi:hypothetical protein [Mesorhizobium sp. AR02]|nr:hypothetical protein [Mesorhizobium sp. AR02]